jgi:hypothetical protein
VVIWVQLESNLAGAGTQTAGLGFGGYTLVQLDSKCNRRIFRIYLGSRWKFKYSKKII